MSGPVATRASELCKYFPLGAEAKTILKPEMTPEQFVAALAEKSLHPDAIQFISRYLPKRQAVWWALQCAKQLGMEASPLADKAIKTTERWIAEPTEENRKATMQAAEDADTGTAAGCVALAAYYSEGLPPGTDAKSNANAYFMTAKLVTASVLLAAVHDPEQVKPRFQSFVVKGQEVMKKVQR